MNEDEFWGYIAGMFDGEGHPRNYKDSQYNYRHFGLAITNTNRQCLEAIRKFLGTGTINLHREAKGNHSACYTLYISKIDDVLRVARKR